MTSQPHFDAPVIVETSGIGSYGMPIRLKIIIVDDNKDAATTLGMIMGLCGAEVRVFNDGASALKEAESFQPEVALLDINMPEMNGCELATRLRRFMGSKPLFLVAVTGVSDSAAVQRTTAAGFDLHFTKPAQPTEVIAAIANFDWWIRTGQR